MKPNVVLVSTIVSCLALAGVALPQVRTVLQTVPNSDPYHPSGLVQGDEWVFDGVAGDTVAIGVDTRDDTGDGTSNLDPVVALVRPDGSVAATGDDEVACSRPPRCGYACPLLQAITLDQTGRWTIAVLDFGSSGCRGGAYNLMVTGTTEKLLRTLRLRLNDGALGQSGIRRQLDQQKGSR